MGLRNIFQILVENNLLCVKLISLGIEGAAEPLSSGAEVEFDPSPFLDNHKGFIHHFRKFFICHPPIPQTYSSGPSLGKASHVSFLDFINVLTNYYYGSKSPGLRSLSGQLLSHV